MSMEEGSMKSGSAVLAQSTVHQDRDKLREQFAYCVKKVDEHAAELRKIDLRTDPKSDGYIAEVISRALQNIDSRLRLLEDKLI